MAEKKQTAALLARVSDEEQVEGYSLDAQKRAFRALCEGTIKRIGRCGQKETLRKHLGKS